jgi:hypothetical protein
MLLKFTISSSVEVVLKEFARSGVRLIQSGAQDEPGRCSRLDSELGF